MSENDSRYNSSSVEDVENHRSKEDTGHRQTIKDIQSILSLPAGVRFFKDMFETGHIEGSIFTGNASTYYNLGLRQGTLKYWKLVREADPEAFTRILLAIDKDS
jgi:hypothetical protein